MPINIGTTPIQNIGQIKLGDNINVQRVYRGNDLIFPIGINFETAFNDIVSDIKIQSDGKILVCGYFTSYKGVSANRIIRLNTDGSRDNTFSGSFNNIVRNVKIQSDGKIIVCGNFTTYSGTSINKIIRLNSNGTIDNTFSSIFGFTDQLYKTFTQSDGKILVGGLFTNVQNIITRSIIRLNSDGTRDTTFNMGDGFFTSGGFNPVVYDIVLQSDNKIIIGGLFDLYNNISSRNIIRLNIDGTHDSSFNVGTGCNGSVIVLKIQSDGKIIAGGAFTEHRGASRSKLVRINNNGLTDTTFNIGTGFNNDVNEISIQTDSKIIVGGLFSFYQSVSTNSIVRLNSDGTRDTSFSIGNGFTNGGVFASDIQSDGKITIGGSYTTYNNQTANRIIQLNTDGSRFST
jgi:uncharacterized delta-60 repeat protein